MYSIIRTFSLHMLTQAQVYIFACGARSIRGHYLTVSTDWQCYHMPMLILPHECSLRMLRPGHGFLGDKLGCVTQISSLTLP